MNKNTKIILFLARISFGFLFFYAGITKVLDANWSAEGFLVNAKTFSGFYAWVASPDLLALTNFVNEWSLTIIGAFLILGLFVRLSSSLGAVLMILYYFPTLVFPHIPPHAYIIDEHIIYALLLALFATLRVGRIWGLDRKFSKGNKFYSHWLG